MPVACRVEAAATGIPGQARRDPSGVSALRPRVRGMYSTVAIHGYRSLRDVVLPLHDSTLVLPGHGPATTMARERTTNPYLLAL